MRTDAIYSFENKDAAGGFDGRNFVDVIGNVFKLC